MDLEPRPWDKRTYLIVICGLFIVNHPIFSMVSNLEVYLNTFGVLWATQLKLLLFYELHTVSLCFQPLNDEQL